MRKSKLYSIEGSIPGLHDMPSGCRFHPRCPHAVERCRSEVPELTGLNGRLVACWRAEELRHSGNVQARPAVIEAEPMTSERKETLIEAVGLSKWYPLKRGTGERSALSGG